MGGPAILQRFSASWERVSGLIPSEIQHVCLSRDGNAAPEFTWNYAAGG
jgi:hypothetical protein